MDTSVQLWSLDYHAYLLSALTRDCVRQCKLDIPRMQVSVNGEAVVTLDELIARLGSGSMWKQIVPFITQTSMYIVVLKLRNVFKMVYDGGRPMSVALYTNNGEFTIDITKMMKAGDKCIHCTIHVSSTSAKVIVTAEKV